MILYWGLWSLGPCPYSLPCHSFKPEFWSLDEDKDQFEPGTLMLMTFMRC